jgi:hypothetical protein
VNGPKGVGPEDAVNPTGVEPECAEPLLQLGHVVTAEIRGAKVEMTIAKFPAGFDQCLPGRFVAQTGHREATSGLKGAQSRLGGDAEDAWVDAGRLESGCAEPPLKIADGVAATSKS